MCQTSMQEAKDNIAVHYKLDPTTAVFTELPNLKIPSLGQLVALRSAQTPAEVKEQIRNSIKSQQGFSLATPADDVEFVVCPVKKGFNCWVVSHNGLTRLLLD